MYYAQRLPVPEIINTDSRVRIMKLINITNALKDNLLCCGHRWDQIRNLKREPLRKHSTHQGGNQAWSSRATVLDVVQLFVPKLLLINWIRCVQLNQNFKCRAPGKTNWAGALERWA